MKRCYILSFITLCILQAGCKKQTIRNADIHVIDFEQCFDTERQMFLSEIADSIEYIELKTPEDVIITKIGIIKQVDDFLIINANYVVYLFHKNGQFIRQIGSRGQGPGEYILPYSIDIDHKKKEIVISDTYQLLFYDLDGNFLRSKKWMEAGYIGIFDSTLWMGDIIYSANLQKYKAVAVSLHGEMDTVACIPNALYGFMKSDKTGADDSGISTLFYHKNDSLFFKGDASNDTIWKLSGANAEPYAFIDMGKYKLPPEFERWVSDEAYQRNRDRYWAIQSVLEDDRYFFLWSHWRKLIRLPVKGYAAHKYIVYDKKQKKGFFVKDDKKKGIIDDLLGGPPVWPRWISNEYYMSPITAEILLEKVRSGDFIPPAPLKEQLSRMNEGSNDLIILCHRKK
ncbi:MAG: 6-bladed beta-propeller [Tannerella sp.]|jgi:hypothetical protein|nr:6-bladed beta-propeller [Tannerella sp.]